MESGAPPRSSWDVRIPMRDGVQLSADIHFPEAGARGGPYPAVLIRTPYSKQNPVYVKEGRYLAEHGYAVVLQDVRGRHDSDGGWVPFVNEGADGYDTVEWIAAQPWSTGRIGTMGGSYSGWTQWALAREQPPHLTTMVSTATCGAFAEELPFHNGVLMLVMLGWLNFVGGRTVQNAQLVTHWPDALRHLPVREMDAALGRDMPLWREWVEHPRLDDYWERLRFDGDFTAVDIPVLHITGWWDADQPGALFMHRGMMSSSPCARDQAIVIGPWDHHGTRVPAACLGGVDFGPAAVMDVLDLHRRWFGRWLADAEDPALPDRARLFITGTNDWVDATGWPPPHVEPAPFYLHSGGRANTLAGDGDLSRSLPRVDEPADSYVYDPEDPVIAAIDENFYAAEAVATPLDHRFKHRRDDVLVYTSDPFADELVMAGHPVVHLFATTDGPDTDWFAGLHDVDDRGRSMVLAEGRLRGRFHDGLERESLLEPGRRYEFVFELSAVGHVVLPGHRLRLAVTSSDFPLWDRNPNTGEPIGAGTTHRPATNSVLHCQASPSHVLLPVADRCALRATKQVQQQAR